MGAFAATLCASFLTACMNWPGPHHPAQGRELQQVDAAVAAWVQAGRDRPTREKCPALDHVEIVLVNEQSSPCVTFTRESGSLDYGPRAPACLLIGQPYIGAPPHLLIYLHERLDETGRLYGIAHETLHYLRGCLSLSHLREGTRADWWGNVGAGSDPGHQDRELWTSILREVVR